MGEIVVERNVSDQRLDELGVFAWPVWTKAVSEFPWSYDDMESCYFLTGRVIVTPKGDDPVEMGEGDYVVFPKGMTCTWKILENVKKHYQFG
jgi:uncharacterized protein